MAKQHAKRGAPMDIAPQKKGRVHLLLLVIQDLGTDASFLGMGMVVCRVIIPT